MTPVGHALPCVPPGSPLRDRADCLQRSTRLRIRAWMVVLLAALLALTIPALSALAGPIGARGVDATVTASTKAPRIHASRWQYDRAPDDAERSEFHAKKRRLVALKVENTSDARPATLRTSSMLATVHVLQATSLRRPATNDARSDAPQAAPRGIATRRMPPGQAPPRA